MIGTVQTLGTWRGGWQARWGRLTREGRDTLWLLAMLALVVSPHAARLPWWAGVGAAGALAWRGRLAWTEGRLPGRWMLSLMLVASLLLTGLTYRTLIGREPGITLIVILTALKCLELKARRDSLVCLYLGFFLILTQFLYSQSIGTAVLMVGGVWGLLTALVLGQRPAGRPPLAEAGRDAGRAMVWGLPLMLVLFVFFPRFGPLWSLPQDAGARTGLSDTLALGEVAELAQDDSIAMRLRFQGRPPASRELYFRGPTLDMFDGKTWRPFPYPPAAVPPAVQGPLLDYEATLEPSRLDVLPLLDGTVAVSPINARLALSRAGLEWRQRGGLDRRMQVQARAARQWQLAPDLEPRMMRLWTRLPRGFNPRTSAWAAALRATPELQDAPAPALAARVLAHVRQAGFRYTLAPGLPEPGNPHLIDDFWLDRREGFCEHFATAFVVVMRAMGVPARVVTGYQGAELNPVDGQYIVRNANAHAWAEFWTPGRGWVRADPTAAVDPSRVEQSPRPRPFAGLPGPLSDLDPSALRRLRDLWDAADHRWNVWVLQYSRGSQMRLLESLGWQQPDWQDLARVLAWALAALGLGSAVYVWLTRQRGPRQPWARPLARVDRALASLGLGRPPGPEPAPASAWRAWLLSRWPAGAPALRDELLTQLDALDALRYGPAARGRRPGWMRLARHIEQHARRAKRAAAHSAS